MNIQGVEYDQEDGVVPDLEEIIYEWIVKRKKKATHPEEHQCAKAPSP